MAAPTRTKQRLGNHLRHLRTTADASAKDAGAELKASETTINRYESGHVLPSWGAVRTLLDLYNATEEDRATASQLWDDAKDEPPAVRLPAGMPKSLRTFLNAERDATDEYVLGSLVVPALLQTEGYMRAINAVANRYVSEDARVEGYITLRLNRQRRLEGSNPLNLHTILDEAVIQRVIGSDIIMRHQLEHLLTVGGRPNITVQIMPFSAGAYGPMSGSCVTVVHPDGSRGVYLEYPAGGAWVDNDKDMRKFAIMFDDAVTAALTPDESADVIRRQARALED